MTERPEKPKILGPKPTIASKPKHVPPVNLKTPKSNVERFSAHFSVDSYQRPSYYDQTDKNGAKAPNSPSTVCCSILSQTANDCCGVIQAKKELNGGKTLTKNESLDSNSSDSGGFKDFVQLELPSETKTHQRKISQPEFKTTTPHTHHRQASQPEQTFQKPSAQVLASFLPPAVPEPSFPKPGKLNMVAQTSQMLFERAEERPKPKPLLISQGQFQQSTKKLEELLSQRLAADKLTRLNPTCLLDGESSTDIEQKMLVQKQIQQKLQVDLKQTVKQIQEIQSIEYRLPQNRKWNESNRSQPAIGLKHTPKAR
ncbi:PREDICTED: uncharacterized protein LOC108559618, partial [Nicrophorus vespilloides]|uniref:Uncharacterized protein LOC108559618 n=1 Tax=Nicrophorus vespilloides TaxID=110193 RepID=A0ABM1MCZ1_NICVS